MDKMSAQNNVLFCRLLAWSFLVCIFCTGCAVVKPYEREKLADPIMNGSGHLSKQTLEQKFYSTQEGSMGGGSGVGGGCGCAK
jgi:hypothetical protein